MVNKVNLLMDFDVIKYILSSRGIEVAEGQEGGIYLPSFNIFKSMEAWKDILGKAIDKLAYEGMEVGKIFYFYTKKETQREDYFRTFLDSNYKLNRKDKDTTAFSSMFTSVIMDNLKGYFTREGDKLVPNIYGLEADDTIALACEKMGIDSCVIMSTDKDFKFKYNTFNPMRMQYSKPQREKLSELMLVGDKADNIAGIAGCGIKSFEKLQTSTCCIEELQESVKQMYLDKKLDFDLTEFMLRPLELNNFEWVQLGKIFTVSTPNIGVLVNVERKTMQHIEI